MMMTAYDVIVTKQIFVWLYILDIARLFGMDTNFKTYFTKYL